MLRQQKHKAKLFTVCLAVLICICTIPANSHTNKTVANASLTMDVSVPALSTNELLWEKTYGGPGDDRAFYMTTTDDNGFLVVGSTTSFNLNKTAAWAVMIDSDGNVIWNRTYVENDGCEFRNIQETSDGFLLVGNTFFSSRNEDAWLVKIDDQGNAVWNKTIGERNFNKVFSATTTTTGFVLAGLTSSSPNGNADGWILKTDFVGNLLWNKTYGQTGDNAFRGTIVDSSGNIAAAGYTDSAGNGSYSFWMVKTDANGTPIWNQVFHGLDSDDKAYALTSSSDGYLVAGEAHSNPETGADAFAAKVDFNGGLVWKKRYGGPGFDVASGLIKTANGGYLVVGFTFSYGQGQRDFWFFSIDDSGNVLWSRTYGRQGYEEAYTAVQLGDNEFVVGGWTNSIGAGSYDFYVIRARVLITNSGFDQTLIEYLFPALLSAIAVTLLIYVHLRENKSQRKTSELDQN